MNSNGNYVVIGHISEDSEPVKVISVDGSIRIVNAGGAVFVGETVLNSNDLPIKIILINNKSILVGLQQERLMEMSDLDDASVIALEKSDSSIDELVDGSSNNDSSNKDEVLAEGGRLISQGQIERSDNKVDEYFHEISRIGVDERQFTEEDGIDDLPAMPANNPSIIKTQGFTVNENVPNDGSFSIGAVKVIDLDEAQSHVYAIVGGNSDGRFAINPATGDITVVGEIDYENIDSYDLSIKVIDNGIPPLTTFKTITIDIENVNETPVANPDVATSDENGSLTINVLANDTDVDVNDNPSSSILLSTDIVDTNGDILVGMGEVSISNNQVLFALGSDFDYLGDGEVMDLLIRYQMSDSGGLTSNSFLSITITGTNDQPVIDLINASGTLEESDSTASLSVDGTLSFTELDSGDIVTVSKSDTSITWNGGDLTSSLSASLMSGFVISNSGWSYSTSANLDFLGKDETIVLKYNVIGTDNSGAGNAASAEEEVTVTITGTNDQPVIDSITTTGALVEGDGTDILSTTGALSFTELDSGDIVTVSKSDTSITWNGGDLTSSISTNLLNGFVVSNEGWSYNTNVNLDFLGKDQTIVLKYNVTAIDSSGATNAESADEEITVIITGTNDSPVISSSLTATVDEDNTLILTQADLITNASDIDGDSLVAVNVQVNGGNATVVDNGDGTFSVTPSENFFGEFDLTFDVTDGSATVSNSIDLTVNDINDAPTINTVDTVESPNHSLLFDGVSDKLTFDDPVIDANNFTMSLSINPNDINNGEWQGFIGAQGESFRSPSMWVNPANNALTIDSYDSVTNVSHVATIPDVFENGTAVQITWVKDGNQYRIHINGDSEPVYVSNNAPDVVYVNDNFNVGGVDNNFAGSIDNVQIYNSALTPEEVSAVYNGEVTQSDSLVFHLDFEGDEPFENLAGTDMPFTVVGSPGIIEEGVRNVVEMDEDAATIIATAADIDGTITLTGSSAEFGTLAMDAEGNITYTPNPEFSGADTVHLVVIDDDGAIATTRFNLRVNEINDAPELTVESTKTVNEDGTTSITFEATDIDNLVTTTATAENGIVVVNTDGTITYTPNENYNGTDTITVTATDEDGVTDIKTSTITVNDINDAPTLDLESTKSVDEDGATTITYAPADIDGAIVSTTATALNGEVVVNTDGTISYTPNENYNGTDTITVISTDDDGATTTETSAITVNSMNDAPTISSSVVLSDTSEDTSIIITEAELIANASDVEGQTLSVEKLTVDSGTLVDNGDNTWTFNPSEHFHGDVVVNYDISDGTDTVAATSSINVEAVADDTSISVDKSLGFASDNFEAGSNGWSSSTTSDSGSFGAGDMLGEFANGAGTISKDYDVPQGLDEVSITFTMHEINTWDGEDFTIVINGEEYTSITLTHKGKGGTNDNDDVGTAVLVDGDGNIVGQVVHGTDGIVSNSGHAGAGEYGQSHEFTITVPIVDGAKTINLGFKSNLDAGVLDESWGIDNITISASADDMDILATEDGGDVSLNLTVNLIDADGSETMSVTISNVPDDVSLSHGTNNGDGTWSIDNSDVTSLKVIPNEDFNGLVTLTVDTITTESSNGDTNTTSETVKVFFAPTNDAAEFSGPATANTDEDTSITLTQGDLLAKATDLDGDALTASNVQVNGDNATVVDNGDGTFTVTPDANFSGELDLTFDVSDGELTTAGTMDLTINSINDGPVAMDDIDLVGTLQLTAAANLEIDSGLSNSTGFSTVSMWFKTDRAEGQLFGIDSYTGDGGHDRRITITSNGNISAYTWDGGTNFETLSTTGLNVADGEWHNFVYSLDGNYMHLYVDGSLAVTGNIGSSGFDWSDTMTIGQDVTGDIRDVKVFEDTGATAAEAKIIMDGDIPSSMTNDLKFLMDFTGNDPYEASGISVVRVGGPNTEDQFTHQGTVEDNATSNFNVLANDSDLDGDTLSISSVSDVVDTNGNVIGTVTVVNVDGVDQVQFIGNAATVGLNDGEQLEASFTYTLSDGNGGADTATVKFLIKGNDNTGTPVVTQNVEANTDEDISITLTQADLLAHATDADGDTLTASNVQINNPDVTIVDNLDGTFTVTTSENFNGDLALSFDVSDGALTTVSTINLMVNPVDDKLVISAPIDATVDEDNTLILTQADLIVNSSDVDGDLLVASNIQVNGTDATVVDNGNGTYTVTPNAAFHGKIELTFDVSDGTTTLPSGVDLTVASVNDAPVISSVDNTGTEDISHVIAVVSDIEGDVSLAGSTAEHGILSLDADGNVTYTPDANYNGAATVNLSVTDLDGVVVTQEINLTIDSVNDIPIFVEDTSIVGNGDEPVRFTTASLLANDIDADGDTLSITEVTATANTHGTVELIDNKSINLDGNDYIDVGSVMNDVTASDGITFEATFSTTDVSAGIHTNVLFMITDPNGSANMIRISITEDGEVGIMDDNVNAIKIGDGGLNDGKPHTISVTAVNGQSPIVIIDGVEHTVPETLTLPMTTSDRAIIGGDWDDDVMGDYFTGSISDISISSGNNLLLELKTEGDDVLKDTATFGNSATIVGDLNTTVTSTDVIFTPDNGYIGDASFEYTISDGNGGTDTATVDLNVTTTPNSGTLIDGVIEGIFYETSSGLTGMTDENGGFQFNDGDTITFSIGNVELGSITAEEAQSGQTFLQDIADVDRGDLNDHYLENMATFLQSLDSDEGDNIVITAEIHTKLEDLELNLHTASEEEVKALVESIGKEFVSEEDAMEHVQEMLEKYTDMQSDDFDAHTDDSLTIAVLGTLPVVGVNYTTSSGITGITNTDGSFSFNIGDEITFSNANGQEIASIAAEHIGSDKLITMQELLTHAPDMQTQGNEAGTLFIANDDREVIFTDADLFSDNNLVPQTSIDDVDNAGANSLLADSGTVPDLFSTNHDNISVSGGASIYTFDLNAAVTPENKTSFSVSDFNIDEGDVLLLGDLMVDEDNSLEQLLDFSISSSETVINIRDVAGGDVTRQVTLDNVDLSVYGNTDAEIINKLLDDGNLQIDS
ncbi:MAG: tandem-95 repeat protein [Candidatus Endonucleobacter sp. (ex Gigantidas childressi)]|nr:tandem-95 repeat protein [Candidatus Endonucleobacter sp. (ex Gigantidas childressi)]